MSHMSSIDSGERWRGDDEAATWSLRLQTFAPPLVVLLAWWANSTAGLSSFFSRSLFGMWVHELGHAITSWWCGYFAFPGPWRTITGDERNIAVIVAVVAVTAATLFFGVRTRRVAFVVAGVIGAVAFVAGTVVATTRTASMAITFGGDAANLILGPLLVLTMQLPRAHPTKQRWLHWGFLVIGAFAFADVAQSWLRAKNDVAEIPFGNIDGVGFSDASKLVEDHHWTEAQLVNRYNTLAMAGWVVLVVGQVLGVRAARRRLRDERDDGDVDAHNDQSDTADSSQLHIGTIVEPPAYQGYQPVVTPTRHREPIDL
jgi:hypothetical protein